MARPAKNNADYFPHDNDTRNDPRVKALRKKFGHEGYSIYIMMLEYLCKQDYFEFTINDLNLELLAGDFVTETPRLQEIIDYCIQLQLLSKEKNKILSNDLKLRLRGVLSKRNTAKQKFLKKINADNEVSVTETTQKKRKEIKVNKSKVNNGVIKPQKKSQKKIPFDESEIFDKDKFLEALVGTQYELANIDYYHESFKNWSDEGNKKNNWLATAKNWMQRDMREGKFVDMNFKPHKNENTTYKQQTGQDKLAEQFKELKQRFGS